MIDDNTDFPEGWEQVKLGDVLHFNYGKSLPAKVRDSEGFPVYGSNGIVGNHSKPQIEGPVLLVGRKGSIGAVHLCDGPCSAIDTTYFVDEFFGQPIGYWYYRLKSLPLADLNRATALPGLNRQDTYGLEVKIPPLAEQRRIVRKIEALQERSRSAREALAEVGPLLDQFRQSLLAAAFRGDLTADWRAANPNVEPASELLNRIRQERRQKWEQWEVFKYEVRGKKVPKNVAGRYETPGMLDIDDCDDFPEIPSTWRWATIDAIGIVGSGKRLPNGSKLVSHHTGFPYIRAGNLKGGTVRGEILFLTKSDYETISQYVVNAGDNYLTIVGASIGDAGTIPEEFDGVNLTENAAKIMALINSDYLGFILRSQPLQYQIQSKILSAAQGKLALRRIKQLVVPIPPLEEQSHIAMLIKHVLQRSEELTRDAASFESDIAQLDQSILAKAFRGELVPQNPNDEPASELLARIRNKRAETDQQKSSMPRKATKHTKRTNTAT